MALKVTELRTLAGDVVGHEVEDKLVVLRQFADVSPRTEGWIDLAVRQGSESAISRRGKRRENVDSREQAIEWTTQ